LEALATVANVNTYNQYGVYEYYSLRGFSEGAQMVDGVRNEGNRVRTQLSNVERVEVLKGPASVLSGNEAIGSSVNIVLKKPSAQPLYEASLSAGSFNTRRTYGGATGRLGRDSLLFRLDFGVDTAEGFRHDPSNKLSVTPTVAWQMTRDDRLEVRYSFNRNDISGDGGIPQVTRPDGTVFIPDVPRDTRYNTPQDFALSYDHNIRLSYTRQFGNNLGLRNLYSPRVYDDEYWVVLGGWDHQDYHSRTTRSNNANITTTRVNLYNPVETHVPWTDFTISRYDHAQNYTEGVYGQDHVELGSRVTAVVLVRADYVDGSTYNNPVTNNVEGVGPLTKSKQRRFSSRYGMVYQPADRLDLYGQYATSFKPNFTIQPDGSELKPEIGAQWEFGQRLRLVGDRVSVNTSAFRISRRNVALSRPGGFFDQAGEIQSDGLETDVNGEFSSWYFTAGYGYTNAKYVDYVTTTTAGVRTVLSGNVKPRAPHHSFNYQAARNWRTGLTLAVSGRTLGHQFLNDANTLFFDGYSLVNLAASYTRGRTQFAVNVNNLTDTEYWASTLGNRQFYPGESRRVMGTLRVMFN
jgi:iron complex outermembrane receptor protein